MFNPAVIGKALKARDLWKAIPDPIRIHEHVQEQEDGTAIYVFQAKFTSKEAAEMLMKLSALSADLEKVMKS